MSATPKDSFALWEGRIHSFVTRDDVAGHAQSSGGAVSGLRVGVKDIIDVAGLPTRNGSKACETARPAQRDAPVVAALRAAGARIVGKTITTEFAFTDPTACRNPYDTRRSPGGSSSGSGAAVAAGLVDVALGTQTAGSLCRPAAYCGVVGFKPTHGLLTTEGMTPLAPSFDTIGIIAASVNLIDRCLSVLAPDVASNRTSPSHCRVAQTLLDREVLPSTQTQDAYCAAARALGPLCAGIAPKHYDLDVAQIVADHRLVMNFEAATAHTDLLRPGTVELLQPKFRAGLRAGASTSAGQARDARQALNAAKDAFWATLENVDIVLTLPVPEGAPLVDGTTGFQDWLTPWTVFGGPLICLPWGLDQLGRPVSVMLAGHPGQDATVLSMAAALEAQAPHMPPPPLPQG